MTRTLNAAPELNSAHYPASAQACAGVQCMSRSKSAVDRVIALTQPCRVLFGRGSLSQLADEFLRRNVRNVLLISSSPLRSVCEDFSVQLRAKDIGCTLHNEINSEPTGHDLEACLALVRSQRPDMVLGIGGGSALDVAKLAAGLGQGSQNLEEVFGAELLKSRQIGLACVPTTAGTGSEASPNAILLDTSCAPRAKKAVISRHLVPDVVCLDPDLTVSLPPALTATTGIDALTHCIEAYVNVNAHPMVDTWALEGIRLIARSLVPAVVAGDDLQARSDLLLGSYLGGMCLGPVNTAAVHALAYPLGSEYGVAHGLSNALLLPHVMRFNLTAATERYANIALALGEVGNDPAGLAARGVSRIVEMIRCCSIPMRLRDVGIARDALPALARAAMSVTRLLKNNPRAVSEADALEVYNAAW